ncbi:MAG: hypothetical protein HW411_1004 [Gammaproteobacteria bacterium]|nr:hypothetical protein [Gammaproteobacteria bacterium]
MHKFTRADLYTLEKYAEIRGEFRDKVMTHKKNRQLPIGPNATLYFEDALTMQYQIQEMLRVERIFEPKGIQEELDAYNPLIPDGTNWKATFMIEFDDEDERRQQLARLIDIESCVWMKIDKFDPVIPVADEDMDRTTEDKTSSVHFLRFELNKEMITALKRGASLSAGINHAAYQYTVDPVPDNLRRSLLNDLS